MDSLRADELFIKNAIKNSTMHGKAVEIVRNAMTNIMENESETSMREVNTDVFIQ